MYPESFHANMYLCVAYYRLGKFTLALKYFKKAEDLANSENEIYY